MNKQKWEYLAAKVVETVPAGEKGVYAVGFLAGLTANYDFEKKEAAQQHDKEPA